MAKPKEISGNNVQRPISLLIIISCSFWGFLCYRGMTKYGWAAKNVVGDGFLPHHAEL